MKAAVALVFVALAAAPCIVSGQGSKVALVAQLVATVLAYIDCRVSWVRIPPRAAL